MLRRIAYGLLGLALLSTAALGVGVLVDFNGLQYYVTGTPSPNTKAPSFIPITADGAPMAGTGAASGTGSQFVQGGDAAGAAPTSNPFVVAGISSGTGFAVRATAAINNTNSAAGQVAYAPMGLCDDVSPTTITENQMGVLRMGCADHGLLVSPQPYPNLATPIAASSGNVANAVATATLAANATKTTYITGFQCTSGGATAGASAAVTVTGTVTATQAYAINAGTLASIGGQLIVTFPTPVPGSAVNTAIVVSMGALGAGNANAACSAQGFQL